MSTFNITNLLSAMGITSGSIYLKSKCNEDGHLLVIEVYNSFLSNNKLIVCEMNIKHEHLLLMYLHYLLNYIIVIW